MEEEKEEKKTKLRIKHYGVHRHITNWEKKRGGIHKESKMEHSLSASFLLMASLAPVLQFVVLVMVGVALSRPRVNIITPQSRKALSGMVTTVFLPSLVFVKLVSSMSVEVIQRVYFAPIAAFANIGIGALLGQLVVLLTRPERRLRRLVIALCAIGNVGNMPLVIIAATCDTVDGLFGSVEQCLEDGTAFVALGIAVLSGVLFSVFFEYLRPERRSADTKEEDSALRGNDDEGEDVVALIDASATRADDNEMMSTQPRAGGREGFEMAAPEEPVGRRDGGGDDAETSAETDSNDVDDDSPLAARMALLTRQYDEEHGGRDEGGETQGDVASSPTLVEVRRRTGARTRIGRVVNGLGRAIWTAMTPPVIASLVGISVALTPLKDLIVGQDAPLRFLTGALTTLGNALVAIVVLLLGSTLSEGPATKQSMSLQTLIGVCVSKLILSPALGIAVVAAGRELGMIPMSMSPSGKDGGATSSLALVPDVPADAESRGVQSRALFEFVLLMQQATPSAVTLLAVMTLHNTATEECAYCLFWEMVCFPLTLVISLSTFFLYITYSM